MVTVGGRGRARLERVLGRAGRIEAVLEGLLVERGPYRLVCNFAPDATGVPAPGAAEVVLSTHAARIEGDVVRLPALSGALVR